jgi:hypothetical protein
MDSQVQAVTGLEIHFGHGPQPIQVALAESLSEPSRAALKTLFADRKGNQNTLIVVVVHGDQASLFGPDADTEVMKQKVSTAEAILNSILDQPNELLAYQRATSIWRSKQTTDLVGFTNNGLFASHYIRSSVNHHPKWTSAQEASIKIQNLRDQALITALGFEITSSPSNTLVLRAKGQDHRAVAILLDQPESFDSKSTRLQASPVEWSLAIAAEQGAPWVIAIKDSQIRLYPAKDGVGVGQKSQAETYFEIDLLTIEDDKTGLLNLIFSAEALAEGGTADELLANSRKFASELGVRLRERVYESVVPMLSTEVANQLRAKGHELDSKGLQLSYELTLRILFRLLFQAYAEDRGLLPSGRNENFDKNSMKHWAQYLLEREVDAPYGDAATIWYDLIQIWDAIDQGNPDMQIPAYNGGLFGSNADLHPEGALIRTLAIPDRVLAPALRALVIDDNTEDGVAGAVDFRSLSVREFGTIYEGLLESSLSVADQDLTVDSKGAWVPAKPGDQVLAKANEVYFHSASGERKATGSYYTPSFIVDHLIERSVEPALNQHLARVKSLINTGDQAGAYKLFFDFRVADLAMGSAHFLVAAIDKIETGMRSFLVQPGNHIEGVTAELIRLESAAKESLGNDEAAFAEIERASLLRRQIARRCIYGLDINSMAVELSRLAIWIHTFVPGLPMSSLEHNLVCANSLTGIGSVDEGLNALIPERAKGHSTLFDDIVEQSLVQAKELLEDVAQADEADKKQALKAAEVAKKARVAAAKSKLIFDLAIANRNGIISIGAALSDTALEELRANPEVQAFVEAVQPAHLPYLFPEVFLRDEPGFDALVGNPPWEELVYEEIKFWLARFPGLKGNPVSVQRNLMTEYRNQRPDLNAQMIMERSSSEFMRKAISSGTYPGMETGHADLYKAFAWRFFELLRSGGFCSLVLPRSALAAKGLELWRRNVAKRGRFSEVVTLSNKKGWVFQGVHERYSFALLSLQMGIKGDMELAGPISSPESFKALKNYTNTFRSEDVLSWNEAASFPNLQSKVAAEIFSRMRLQPSIKASARNDLRFLPVQGDLNQTSGASLYFADDNSSGDMPVVKGSTFNIWSPQDGDFAGSADSNIVLPALQSKFRRKLSLSHGYPSDPDWLPIHSPRIAFRDVTNPTNSRTMIVCMQPAGMILLNSAPYLINLNGDALAEAYLLGVLSSLPFDWYSRCFVELHMNFFIFNSLPVPKFDSENAICRRVAQIAALLASQDKRLAGWFDSALSINESSHESLNFEQLTAELDGLVAALYELTSDQLIYIFNHFQLGWFDASRLAIALQALEETRK